MGDADETLTEIPAAEATAEPPAGDFESLGTEYDALLAQEGDTFTVPRSQIERYANEHKTYRQRWSPVARNLQGVDIDRVGRAVSGLDPADQAFYFDTLAGLRSTDAGVKAHAAAQLRQALDSLSPAQQQQLAEQVEQQAAPDDFDPLDPEAFDSRVSSKVAEQVQRILAERDATQDQQRRTESALSEIRGLAKTLEEETGIEGLGDPTSEAYDWLLSTVKTRFANLPPLEGLRQAAEYLKTGLDRRAQQMLKAKKDTTGVGPASPQRGVAPAGQQEPQDMSQKAVMQRAAASAQARIEAAMSRPGT